MLNKEKVKLISVAYFIDSVYPKYYHVTDIKMINQIFWILFWAKPLKPSGSYT